MPGLAAPAEECAQGLKAFPFLKPWVSRLGNFVAPVESGNVGATFFYGIGATTAGPRAAMAWKEDAVTLEADWRAGESRVETVWLGKLPPLEPTPSPASQQTPAMVMPGATRGGGALARFLGLLYSPAEQELLARCSPSGCKIKFEPAELRKIAGVSSQYRLFQYHAALFARADAFSKKGELHAYEGSGRPLDWEDFQVSPSFPMVLGTHFKKPSDRGNFGYEQLDAEPGKHKPVMALFSRQCEQAGSGLGAYTSCSDLVVYNNHYFDFWGRRALFFPWCGASVVLLYETMDVDQVKESSLVHLLFGGQMRKSLESLLEARLRRIHMLGY